MNIETDYIGQIVSEDFRTASIFKENGIDFCCKGDRTIEEACVPKNLDPRLIYESINQLSDRHTSIDFNSWPLDLLVEYIEKTHHQYVEEKSPMILGFLHKLSKVHGEKHPELHQVYHLFHESTGDLAAHLKKEELILFPFIKNMVRARKEGRSLPKPQFGTVENPVTMMKHDHTIEGDRFREIASITDHYSPPEDACNTYKVAFAMLQDFENDLHKHIHLESNILFPKAINLEKELSKELS